MFFKVLSCLCINPGWHCTTCGAGDKYQVQTQTKTSFENVLNLGGSELHHIQIMNNIHDRIIFKMAIPKPNPKINGNVKGVGSITESTQNWISWLPAWLPVTTLPSGSTAVESAGSCNSANGDTDNVNWSSTFFFSLKTIQSKQKCAKSKVLEIPI